MGWAWLRGLGLMVMGWWDTGFLLRGVEGSEGVGLPTSLSPSPRSSNPSATFQKLWTSASSRPHALARPGSTAWLLSPGQTTRSWWVLDPPPLPALPEGGERSGR